MSQAYLLLLLTLSCCWDLTACKQQKYVDAKGMAWEYEIRQEQLDDGRTTSYIIYNGAWTTPMDGYRSSESTWLHKNLRPILALAFCYML